MFYQHGFGRLPCGDWAQLPKEIVSIIEAQGASSVFKPI